MSRSRELVLLSAIAGATLSEPAFAAPRVELDATVCEAEGRELEPRLSSALGARSSAGWSASVTFAETTEGIRVAITTRELDVARGETNLVVASCREALDAAAVVLSLALGAGDEPSARLEAETRAPSSAKAPPLPPERSAPVLFTAPAPSRDAAPKPARSSEATGFSRVSLAGGVDAGTLPLTTAFVAGGITHAWPALEVRAALRYGLPTEHERAETGLRESVRRDFGALGLDACYGVGTRFRVAACAGSELGVVRVARRLESEEGSTLDEDEAAPRLSGMLAAIVSARTGPIHPELELSGSSVAFGRLMGASPVAFRAAAGAAIEF